MNLELSLSRVAIFLTTRFHRNTWRSYCTGVMRSPLGAGGAIGVGGGGGGGDVVTVSVTGTVTVDVPMAVSVMLAW